jgi:hypothetical membrane protein
VQFFLTQLVVASAWSTPFSLTARFISDLGNTACAFYPPGTNTYVCSPMHLGMNASFIFLGLTMVAGAVLTRDAFSPGWERTAANVLFAIAGFGVILVGCYPENENIARHATGAGLNFVGGNLGLILFGIALRPIPRRRSLSRFSIAAGTLGMVATVLFVSDGYLGLGPGGMERLAAYPIPIWQIVAGLALWPNATGSTAPPQ